MDVALVRMQSDSMKPKEERRNYKHVIDALRRCAAEEGMGSLYAVRHGPRLCLFRMFVLGACRTLVGGMPERS